MGISILTYTKSIGPVTIDPRHFDAAQISQNPVAMPDAHAAKEAQTFLDCCIAQQDSSGGIIECVITGFLPASVIRFLTNWMPVWRKQSFPSVLSKALKSEMDLPLPLHVDLK